MLVKCQLLDQQLTSMFLRHHGLWRSARLGSRNRISCPWRRLRAVVGTLDVRNVGHPSLVQEISTPAPSFRAWFEEAGLRRLCQPPGERQTEVAQPWHTDKLSPDAAFF